jgi:transposase, IS4 family
MDATWIITAFVVIDTLMERLGHRSDVRAQVPDSEILTIAVVAATYVGSHHERAVQIMHGCGYLSGRISVSRFNRRLHQLADWMAWIPDVLGEVFTTGDVFIIDSLPLPVCRRVRARRCRKVRGREFCGYCAAKREKFFGWRLHLVCRPDGVPVRVQMLPAGMHDLTPVHELAYGLPAGARLLGDKAYIAPLMRPASWRRRGCAWSSAPGEHASARLVYGRHRIARVSSWHRDDERSTVNWRRWALDA